MVSPSLRIQIWSSNYDPEPQGIAPVSGVVARTLSRRGHQVTVVAAHPHYPAPVWGTRVTPYRERREGVDVLRLPIWAGRANAAQRARQELSFVAGLGAASPILPTADVILGVTPSFPALAVLMATAAFRRTPWVMWLQDILPDGAVMTGVVREGLLLSAARRLERAAYRSAERIVVVSDAFRRNLMLKGVPEDKITVVFNPLTRSSRVDKHGPAMPPQILVMGNIGRSQGLDDIVRAFEASAALAAQGALLRIAGSGVAEADVAQAITTSRVEMLGLLPEADLVREIRLASLGIVTQRPDVAEFNLPSKLMNYFAAGLPVLASVRPESETALIVERSQGGWVTDAASPGAFAAKATELLASPGRMSAAGVRGRAFADENFAADCVVDRIEGQLLEAASGSRRVRGPAASLRVESSGLQPGRRPVQSSPVPAVTGAYH
jgi:colanic acid biosynthesis glycosyl transferase WcaI